MCTRPGSSFLNSSDAISSCTLVDQRRPGDDAVAGRLATQPLEDRVGEHAVAVGPCSPTTAPRGRNWNSTAVSPRSVPCRGPSIPLPPLVRVELRRGRRPPTAGCGCRSRRKQVVQQVAEADERGRVVRPGVHWTEERRPRLVRFRVGRVGNAASAARGRTGATSTRSPLRGGFRLVTPASEQLGQAGPRRSSSCCAVPAGRPDSGQHDHVKAASVGAWRASRSTSRSGNCKSAKAWSYLDDADERGDLARRAFVRGRASRRRPRRPRAGTAKRRGRRGMATSEDGDRSVGGHRECNRRGPA